MRLMKRRFRNMESLCLPCSLPPNNIYYNGYATFPCLRPLFTTFNSFVSSVSFSSFPKINCANNPVTASKITVATTITVKICTKYCPITPRELITEIPDGTKRNPIIPVKAVPSDSTCSNLITFKHNRLNKMTNPITDEGIGIGKCVAIILEINIIAENMNACDKKLYTFFVLILATSFDLVPLLYRI
ncbi:hypothetical protein BASH2_00297 [Bacillus anthracis]|nr:hypothetical protein BASH2_00297 [Bacillus anthracis]